MPWALPSAFGEQTRFILSAALWGQASVRLGQDNRRVWGWVLVHLPSATEFLILPKEPGSPGRSPAPSWADAHTAAFADPQPDSEQTTSPSLAESNRTPRAERVGSLWALPLRSRGEFGGQRATESRHTMSRILRYCCRLHLYREETESQGGQLPCDLCKVVPLVSGGCGIQTQGMGFVVQGAPDHLGRATCLLSATWASCLGKGGRGPPQIILRAADEGDSRGQRLWLSPL